MFKTPAPETCDDRCGGPDRGLKTRMCHQTLAITEEAITLIGSRLKKARRAWFSLRHDGLHFARKKDRKRPEFVYTTTSLFGEVTTQNEFSSDLG